MTPSLNPSRFSLALPTICFVAILLAACQTDSHLTQPSAPPDISKYEFEATSEDFLISALDEVHAIANWADTFTNGPNLFVSNDASATKKMTLTKTASDTVYIYGQADGSTVTRTEFPDCSWRQVRTLAHADGTITRETTSGFLSLASGSTATPRPPVLRCIPPHGHAKADGATTREQSRAISSFASGCAVGRPPKPPILTICGRTSQDANLAVGRPSRREATWDTRSLCSGVAMPIAKPPIPVSA